MIFELSFQLNFKEIEMNNESVEMGNSNISQNNRNLRNRKFHLVPILIAACFVITLAIAIIILFIKTKINQDNTEKG